MEGYDLESGGKRVTGLQENPVKAEKDEATCLKRSWPGLQLAGFDYPLWNVPTTTPSH